MRVAILQVGGKAQRIASFTQGAVPKQLLPLYHGAVIDYALEACRIGACTPHIVVPEGDSRIAEYANARSLRTPVFSYSRGNQVQDTCRLDSLYGRLSAAYVMPDTVFKPPTAIRTLFDFLDTGADESPAALALFETDTPQKFGMCLLEQRRRVKAVVDKPDEWEHGSGVAWGLIAWREPVWGIIAEAAGNLDHHFSAVLNRVIKAYGPIPYFVLDAYMDIATEEDYRKALEDGW